VPVGSFRPQKHIAVVRFYIFHLRRTKRRLCSLSPGNAMSRVLCFQDREVSEFLWMWLPEHPRDDFVNGSLLRLVILLVRIYSPGTRVQYTAPYAASVRQDDRPRCRQRKPPRLIGDTPTATRAAHSAADVMRLCQLGLDLRSISLSCALTCVISEEQDECCVQ